MIESSSVTVNTSDTTCSGTVQVSLNNFVNCVRMSSSPSILIQINFCFQSIFKSFHMILPIKIKVINTITDISSNPISNTFLTNTGFTTSNQPDNTAPTLASTTPSDSANNITANTTIAITFSEAMDTTTIGSNTSDTTCSGSLQISSMRFSTCVKMSSSPTVSNSNKTFSFSPDEELIFYTTYKN